MKSLKQVFVCFVLLFIVMVEMKCVICICIIILCVCVCVCEGNRYGGKYSYDTVWP